MPVRRSREFHTPIVDQTDDVKEGVGVEEGETKTAYVLVYVLVDRGNTRFAIKRITIASVTGEEFGPTADLLRPIPCIHCANLVPTVFAKWNLGTAGIGRINLLKILRAISVIF